jgi:hypothetical protein
MKWVQGKYLKGLRRKWKPKDWDKETPTSEYFAELL